MKLPAEHAQRLDARIRRLLVSGKSQREIARLVGLAPSSVSRRVAALREAYEHIRNRRPA